METKANKSYTQNEIQSKLREWKKSMQSLKK